ncbi:unnamed protein product [Gadus morhua 'NCC']
MVTSSRSSKSSRTLYGDSGLRSSRFQVFQNPLWCQCLQVFQTHCMVTVVPGLQIPGLPELLHGDSGSRSWSFHSASTNTNTQLQNVGGFEMLANRNPATGARDQHWARDQQWPSVVLVRQ